MYSACTKHPPRTGSGVPYVQSRNNTNDKSVVVLQNSNIPTQCDLSCGNANIIATCYNNITSDSVTSNNITSVNINSTFINVDDKIIYKGQSFNTIVLRRPDLQNTTFEFVELQCWVNDANILADHSSDLSGYFANWNDKDTAISSISPVSNLYNNILTDTGSESSSGANALVIKHVPLTTIKDVQSIVLYNTTTSISGITTGKDTALGLIIELHNTNIDPSCSIPLAKTNTITQISTVYRFDYQSIGTYTGGFSNMPSTTQIINDSRQDAIIDIPIQLNGNVMISERLTVGGEDVKTTLDSKQDTILSTTDLTCNTITTDGDTTIGGVIIAPNQVRFRASRTHGTTINSNGTLPFNKTLENVGGGYSNSTYTFTAPITGTYYFYAQIFTSGDNKFRADFYTGSTLVQRISREGPGSGSGGNTSFTGSFHYTLNVGQTMYMRRFDGIIDLPVDPFCQFGGYLLC